MPKTCDYSKPKRDRLFTKNTYKLKENLQPENSNDSVNFQSSTTHLPSSTSTNLTRNCQPNDLKKRQNYKILIFLRFQFPSISPGLATLLRRSEFHSFLPEPSRIGLNLHLRLLLIWLLPSICIILWDPLNTLVLHKIRRVLKSSSFSRPAVVHSQCLCCFG